MADTTTIVGSRRKLRISATACWTAAESAREAPPNLCTCGARRVRGGMRRESWVKSLEAQVNPVHYRDAVFGLNAGTSRHRLCGIKLSGTGLELPPRPSWNTHPPGQ